MAKLSLDELQAFTEQVSDLHCVIKEAKLIQVGYNHTMASLFIHLSECRYSLIWAFVLQDLLQKVLDFQAEAKEAMNEETPDSEKLDRLLEFGCSLDVELPEVPKLKQVPSAVRSPQYSLVRHGSS